VRAAEQVGDRVAREVVGLVLEPVDLDRVAEQAARIAQVADRLLDLGGGGGDDAGELDRGGSSAGS